METNEMCKNCGAEFGLHHYKTKQCPVHGKESPIDRKQEWQTSTFEPGISYEELKQQRDDLLEACKEALESMENPAVLCQGEWQQGLFCGLEDQVITDRYEACMFGYERALEKVREWVLFSFEEVIAKAE
jgi:ribosomal protein L37E